KLWDTATRQELHSFPPQRNWISSVVFSGDGHYLLTASVDRTVRIWELGVQSSGSGIGHVRDIRVTAVSPDGKILATGGSDGTARLWELSTGRELHVLSGHQFPVTALVFLPDGKTLVTASDEDKVLKVWDLTTAKEKLAIKEQ